MKGGKEQMAREDEKAGETAPYDQDPALAGPHGGIDNHLKGFVNAGYGLIQGLGLTLKHLFQPPVTLQYPEERWEPLPGFRGAPVLVTDDQGELVCVGCYACARACPPKVIHIETSRVQTPAPADAEADGAGADGKASLKAKKKLNIDVFSIDMSRCMLCNLCVEACPFDALTMSDRYELADYEPEGLVLDKEELVAIYQGTRTAMIKAGHSWQPVGPDTHEPRGSGAPAQPDKVTAI